MANKIKFSSEGYMELYYIWLRWCCQELDISKYRFVTNLLEASTSLAKYSEFVTITNHIDYVIVGAV